MLKSTIKILFLCLLFITLSINTVLAIPNFNPGPVGEPNQVEMFFRNHESIFRSVASGDTNLNGNSYDHIYPGDTIQAGDLFLGIADVQNITDNTVNIWSQTNTDTFKGYFALEVAKIEQNYWGNGEDLISFKAPSSDPYGLLNTNQNEVFRFYTDNNLYEANGPFDDDVTKATSGDLFFSFSLDDPDVTESGLAQWDGLNSYWYSRANDDFNPITGGGIAQGWAGLNLNINNSGLIFSNVNDPSETLLDRLVDGAFSTEIQSASAGIPWTFNSNDPALVATSVPEPTTMLLFGTGLIGLAGIGRKKFMKKK